MKSKTYNYQQLWAIFCLFFFVFFFLLAKHNSSKMIQSFICTKKIKIYFVIISTPLAYICKFDLRRIKEYGC